MGQTAGNHHTTGATTQTGTDAGRPPSAVPLRGTGADSSGLAPALLFFVAPVLILVAAVALRARGAVSSPPTIVDRLTQYMPDARSAAASEGVPLALLLAVAGVESSGRPHVVSPSGAVGLMQLMPGTADDMARKGREGDPDLGDPATSLRLGARYLAQQLRRFSGPPRGRELALAAYNAGPRRVAEWRTNEREPNDFDAFVEWVPFRETRNYVRRVTEWEQRWREVLSEPDDL